MTCTKYLKQTKKNDIVIMRIAVLRMSRQKSLNKTHTHTMNLQQCKASKAKDKKAVAKPQYNESI